MFISESILNWNRIIIIISKSREKVCNNILFSRPINDSNIKLLQQQ